MNTQDVLNEAQMLDEAQMLYWDMHKDAYGFRPRDVDTSKWTLADFEREFDHLVKVIEQEDLRRKAAEARAAEQVEARIADLIRSGAGDRATALRWLHEAEDTHGDDEYLCYTLGLSYGYFQRNQPVL